MISGRENLIRAVTFADPQYLPIYVYLDLQWLYEKDEKKIHRIEELRSLFPRDRLSGLDYWPRAQRVRENGIDSWKDLFGIDWIDDGHGARVAKHPLYEGYEMLKDYVFPDKDDPLLFSAADEALKTRDDKYVIGQVWFTLFERLWMLRGFENMLTDPYTDTKDFTYLRDKVLDFNLAMIDKWLDRGVDGIYFSDDWGSQAGLLMNPEDWRKFYKPAYVKMYRKIRDKGVHVWMHLCGNIEEIIPDLIEAGVCVLNPLQPQSMDLERVSRNFGGKIAFHGGVDVQGTMIHGKPQDVKNEVHRLVRLFGSFNGGYIGGTSHSIMPETPLDNVIAMYEAFAEHL